MVQVRVDVVLLLLCDVVLLLLSDVVLLFFSVVLLLLLCDVVLLFFDSFGWLAALSVLNFSKIKYFV